MDEKTLDFFTGANYLKRDETTGSTSITLASNNTVTYTVTHGLGYIPFVEVHAELDRDQIVWAGDKIDLYTETSLTGITQPNPKLRYWVTTSTLVISIQNDGTNTSPVQVYWLIYKDYKSAS